MSAGGLLDLKRRIKSVKNTQKITKAMGLVATVKFKAARLNLEKFGQYYEQFGRIVERVLPSEERAENPVYFKKNESNKDLYIVITSDSGLCGSYNANIINAFSEIIKHKKNNSMLIAVGHKGIHYFQSKKYVIAETFSDIGVNPSFEEISSIIKKSMEYFLEGKAGNIYIVYTRFISAGKQTVEIEKLLPLKHSDKKEDEYILFEPSFNRLYEHMIPKYLEAVMYYSYLNSITSEYAVRMSSMDNAAKNASEMLTRLQTMYNRARQSSITQEITEIISGAEALKE